MTRFYSPRRLPELGTVSTVCGGERGSRKARSETDGGLPLASSLFPAIYGIIPSIPELVLLRLWGFFFFFFGSSLLVLFLLLHLVELGEPAAEEFLFLFSLLWYYFFSDGTMMNGR